MKLVFLCKRRPMGRDLIERPYGRFFHLPRLLASRGHEVHVALLSHKLEATVDLKRDGIHWISETFGHWGGLRYLNHVKALVTGTPPDWIIAFSDTYYGILAEYLGRRTGTRSLIDAYDNYESYMPWCKPLHWAWRRALRGATAVSVAGPALAEAMGRPCDESLLVAVMAPDPLGFHPLPRDECRTRLGLPPKIKLVGYFGALYPNRGVNVLFEAMEILRRAVPEARLALSGRVHRSIRPPRDAIWLGYVPDGDMPTLVNSVDVVAVVNRASDFGNYSHPIKLYEAMSCQVPVVASRTLATEWILGAHPYLLAAPGDPEELAGKLANAMSQERIDYGPQPTWEDVACKLELFLSRTSRT